MPYLFFSNIKNSIRDDDFTEKWQSKSIETVHLWSVYVSFLYYKLHKIIEIAFILFTFKCHFFSLNRLGHTGRYYFFIYVLMYFRMIISMFRIVTVVCLETNSWKCFIGRMLKAYTKKKKLILKAVVNWVSLIRCVELNFKIKSSCSKLNHFVTRILVWCE